MEKVVGGEESTGFTSQLWTCWFMIRLITISRECAFTWGCWNESDAKTDKCKEEVIHSVEGRGKKRTINRKSRWFNAWKCVLFTIGTPLHFHSVVLQHCHSVFFLSQNQSEVTSFQYNIWTGIMKLRNRERRKSDLLQWKAKVALVGPWLIYMIPRSTYWGCSSVTVLRVRVSYLVGSKS